jgi:hypothetical protein
MNHEQVRELEDENESAIADVGARVRSVTIESDSGDATRGR